MLNVIDLADGAERNLGVLEALRESIKNRMDLGEISKWFHPIHQNDLLVLLEEVR